MGRRFAAEEDIRLYEDMKRKAEKRVELRMQ